MDLSIVIVNYRTADLVKNCIKRIKEFTHDLDYEIIVVDMCSYDKEALLEMKEEKFPDTKLIFTKKNLGFGAGNNLGIENSRGEYVMIMNSDVYVMEGSINKLYNYIKTNQEVGAASPKLLNGDMSLQHTCYRFYKFLTPVYRRTFLGKTETGKRENDYHLISDWDHNSNKEVDWVQGSCMIIPRKVLEKVGKFDERFFMYFEDTDLCRRIWNAGYKVYFVADSQMIHMHRKQSADKEGLSALTNKLTLIHILSWLKYFKKWGAS